MTSLVQFDDQAPYAQRATFRDHGEIAETIAAAGISLERWTADADLSGHPSDVDILTAYGDEIDALKAAGGYQTCDLIRVMPDHPDRAALRTKFLAEHTHDDDEVRFFVEGAGLFYIRAGGSVYALECTAGDLIVLPAGTVHWFDMGDRPRFTAIRLFTTPEGWVANFTGDPIAQSIPLYEPAA